MDIFVVTGYYYDDHETIGVYTSRDAALAAIEEVKTWTDPDESYKWGDEECFVFDGWTFEIQQGRLDGHFVGKPREYI
jgi:hypothetical protein